MHRLLRRDGDGQRLRIGVADVFGREAHEPARDVQRILAGFDHAREPVDRGIGIAVAHRLVQRRDEVVVLLAGLVVEQRAALNRLLDAVDVSTRRSAVAAVTGAAATLSSSRFSATRASPLAYTAIAPTRSVVDDELRSPPRPRSASVRARVEDGRHLLGRQAAQHEHLRSRQQRRVDLERRVLGRRADEHDVAGLDARQERVLLRLVEAVNLVDEDDRPAAGRPPEPLGLAHHLADFLDAGEHGAERDEPAPSSCRR